ncbi:MAG: mercury methylation ferredoxin HgcB [Desulfovermiculus sp.]|nr:mercury methylation ferredoxin HgcB [Desulfovermiculus sp.]
MYGFRHIEDAVTLEYDPGLCIGCGNCQTVCPHQAFTLDHKKAQVLDRGVCMECGACALNCPVGAIKVRPGVGCAQAILYAWLAQVPILRKVFTPDACCE